jgi:hypothetical protein
VMLFKARRFVEYFPAFAVIFAALACAPLLDRLQWPDRLKRLIPIGLVASLLVPLALTLTQAREAMADQSRPADTYAAASNWLAKYAPPGARIFQADWDDFPRLFFYNTSDTYTIGLDPTYMELYDPDLYNTWVKITRGQIDRPSDVIRSRFGGQYVVTDLVHTAFIDRARQDPGLAEVFRDRHAIVYSVKN